MKLASDSVRLDAEFADGKSVADEERDHIQYFQFAAERGQSVDAQIAMGTNSACMFYPSINTSLKYNPTLTQL